MISIESAHGFPVSTQRVEIVERKGTGHPDSICDAVMDAISVALSRAYRERCGRILHHNIDKSLLAAGSVERHFGGGRVIRPMEFVIGDRATFVADGVEIPVAEIAIETANAWLRQNLRFVDPAAHVRYRLVLAPGSTELVDIFARPGEIMAANDTSAAVGYWPLSPTERAVLDLERFLNGADFKQRFPESGEDVKVMGLRSGNELAMTVAMPLIARFVASEADYFDRKEAIGREITAFLEALPGFGRRVLHFNTLDQPGRGLGGIYLSLLGTSAEDGDSGQVGRGNRVNGIIALNRPLGSEAAAGKNPVSHVGKIYTILAHRLAREICEEVEGIAEATVLLLSRIGTPIDQPDMAAVQLRLQQGRRLGDISTLVRELVGRRLAGIGPFCLELADGRYPVC